MKINIIILYVLLLSGCGNDDSDTTPSNLEQLKATIQYKSIEGVEENLLSLDIYYRDDISNIKPVVIWVHGGGWAVGDKSRNLSDKINLFKTLNYTFVSINYRLSPDVPEQLLPDRIKFPVHNTDVADAVAWVYQNIDQYGGDKNRVALLGHSAGAHLVALTGTNKTFLEQAGLSLSNIKGVAAIDTKGYDVRKEVLEGNEIYINAFGTVEEENIAASPIHNASSTDKHPIFFIAKRGSNARIAVADAFIEELSSNGVATYQVNGSIYNHTGINQAIGQEGETVVTPALIDFFEQCFK